MQTADERADVYGGCGPRLNEERDRSYWLNEVDGSPKPALDNEKPQGKTVPYEEIVQRWQ